MSILPAFLKMVISIEKDHFQDFNFNRENTFSCEFSSELERNGALLKSYGHLPLTFKEVTFSIPTLKLKSYSARAFPV